MVSEHNITISARSNNLGLVGTQLREMNKEISGFQSILQQGIGKEFLSKEQINRITAHTRQISRLHEWIGKSIQEEEQKIKELETAIEHARGKEQEILQDNLITHKERLDGLKEEIDLLKQKETHLRQEQTALPIRGGGPPQGMAGSVIGMGSSILQTLLPLIGIAGIGGMLFQGISQARGQLVSSTFLGMRMGESPGDLLESIREGGVPWGFSSLEAIDAANIYSQRGGDLTFRGEDSDLNALMAFTRGFGLEIDRVADMFGQFRAMGASNRGEQRDFAELLADAIERGGMQQRVAEALEGFVAVSAQLARRTFAPDTETAFALQTYLQALGDMEGLYGLKAHAADITSAFDRYISGDAGGDAALLMSVALRQFGEMHNIDDITQASYYDILRRLSHGLEGDMGRTNLQALMEFVTHGDPGREYSVLMLQQILGSAGYNIGIQALDELYRATDGFQDLSESVLQGIIGEGGLLSREETFKETPGALFLEAEVKLSEQLATVGAGLVEDLSLLKSVVGDAVGKFNDLTEADFFRQLGEWTGVSTATIAAATAVITVGGLNMAGAGLTGLLTYLGIKKGLGAATGAAAGTAGAAAGTAGAVTGSAGAVAGSAGAAGLLGLSLAGLPLGITTLAFLADRGIIDRDVLSFMKKDEADIGQFYPGHEGFTFPKKDEADIGQFYPGHEGFTFPKRDEADIGQFYPGHEGFTFSFLRDEEKPEEGIQISRLRNRVFPESDLVRNKYEHGINVTKDEADIGQFYPGHEGFTSPFLREEEKLGEGIQISRLRNRVFPESDLVRNKYEHEINVKVDITGDTGVIEKIDAIDLERTIREIFERMEEENLLMNPTKVEK